MNAVGRGRAFVSFFFFFNYDQNEVVLILIKYIYIYIYIYFKTPPPTLNPPLESILNKVIEKRNSRLIFMDVGCNKHPSITNTTLYHCVL